MKSKLTEVERLAWRFHHANGHPDGYDGPCWGPTEAELAEARRVVAEERAGERR
jgi:hypothetical protein